MKFVNTMNEIVAIIFMIFVVDYLITLIAVAVQLRFCTTTQPGALEYVY